MISGSRGRSTATNITFTLPVVPRSLRHVLSHQPKSSINPRPKTQNPNPPSDLQTEEPNRHWRLGEFRGVGVFALGV